MWERRLLGRAAATVSQLVNRRSIAAAHGLARRASSPGSVRNIQLWKLRRTLEHAARHSPYYRELFRGRGVDVAAVHHPSDLGDLTTSPRDLVEHGSEAFLCAQPQLVYETTGTTHKPKTLYYSHQEVEDAASLMAVGLHHVGIRPEDRVISTQDFHYWTGGPWFARALSRLGCFTACPGKIPIADVYERLEEHRYNVLIGDVSWILRLTEMAEERGPRPLKLILGAAEGLPRSSREYVEKVWGTRMYMCYGCSEGAGGMECHHRDGYHLNEFSYVFEVLDPDPEGYGEVAFTTLDRTTMPLIRYRIGDVARIVPGRCDCGIATQRLSTLRGRSDEIVMLGGEGVSPAVFEALLDEVPEVSGDWQAVIRHDDHQDVCELRLELHGGDIASAEKRFLDVLRARHADTLWKNRELGLFALRFTEAARGSLRSGRKLRRLVDEREP
ncbi:MAG: AMP-binding protein [Myxococcota bacterium]|nr:AMP-binding protein [Myxococcota bacterium]